MDTKTEDNITVPCTCLVCHQPHFYTGRNFTCLPPHRRYRLCCNLCGQIFTEPGGARLDMDFHLYAIREAQYRLPIGWRRARPEPEVRDGPTAPMSTHHLIGMLRERAGEKGVAAVMTAQERDWWRFLELSQGEYHRTSFQKVGDVMDDLIPIVRRWLRADHTDTLVLLLTRPFVAATVTPHN